MNEPIENIVSEAGMVVHSQSQNEGEHEGSPILRATTNREEIERQLSQPGTVYAAIQEEHNEPIIQISNELPHQISDEEYNEILGSVGYESHDDVQTVSDHEYTEYQELVPTESTIQPQEVNVENNEVHEEEKSRLKLPENSPTLLIDDSTSRFSGTLWYEAIQKSRIILAGLGGIGSWTALLLARMSPASLVLYDDDYVDVSNMSGQLYSKLNLGESKTASILGIIRDYTNTHGILAVNEKFDSNTEAGNIMICGFDSMAARRVFFLKWKDHVQSIDKEFRKNCLFIDGRLSIDTLQVFTITGEDDYNINNYQNNYLFSDYDADETICSIKQTSYMASMIASFIVNSFTNFIANGCNPDIPFDQPFFIEYDSKNMLFKTIN